jgi:hypothetical protein
VAIHLLAAVVAILLGCRCGYNLTVISAIIVCINSSFTDIPVLYFVFLCMFVCLWNCRDRKKFCFLYVFLSRSVFAVDYYYYLINELEIKLESELQAVCGYPDHGKFSKLKKVMKKHFFSKLKICLY